MICHQRKIRDQLAAEQPRPVPDSLAGYSIETISRSEATPIILRYEWLGTIGRPSIIAGLFAPDRELHGVACFGWGPGGRIGGLIGEPALCLERGACVHYAPRNAASFLINGACKMVHRTLGIARFFAYGDPVAGEYGAVYQAAGWVYLGQGLNGQGKTRQRRIFVLPCGADPDDQAAWCTTRELRRGGRRWRLGKDGVILSDSGIVPGWRWTMRPAKHVYATNVGRDRRSWRKAFAVLPYPAPRPELKLLVSR